MDLSGFFKVTVKVETTEVNSKGVEKTKTKKEVYIVENCADAKRAAQVVETEMNGRMDEWMIESVKEEKNIVSVLDSKD